MVVPGVQKTASAGKTFHENRPFRLYNQNKKLKSTAAESGFNSLHVTPLHIIIVNIKNI